MLKNIRLSLFIEVGLLIPTILVVLERGIAWSYSDRLTNWFLTFLIGTIVYCIYLFQNNVKAEIVKAICSIAISIILVFHLTFDQRALDVLALLVQSFFSASILHNLIKNYSSYK
ncbi:hypothetical protein EC844_1475 [Acinetobacter calcoaceticus]|uniref:Uncharacterized protein n=1 Tax=Acinetobacter calcoaceticus TaxID=471 RepID=A0A4R1X6W3_ACICA|nr:hypothetical protein EC844_1475 [Acinetobacter calcoaceticus]